MVIISVARQLVKPVEPLCLNSHWANSVREWTRESHTHTHTHTHTHQVIPIDEELVVGGSAESRSLICPQVRSVCARACVFMGFCACCGVCVCVCVCARARATPSGWFLPLPLWQCGIAPCVSFFLLFLLLLLQHLNISRWQIVQIGLQ